MLANQQISYCKRNSSYNLYREKVGYFLSLLRKVKEIADHYLFRKSTKIRIQIFILIIDESTIDYKVLLNIKQRKIVMK